MRVAFVSDVHGNIEALAPVADAVDQLVVLGDLLDYVDYHDPARGILGTIFGAEQVSRFTQLRLVGDFHGLRELNHRMWDGLADPVGTLNGVVAERYEAVLATVGDGVLLTLGNVDVAAVWNDVVGDRLPYLDAQVVELGGRRLGFVAGGSTRPGVTVRPSPTAWQPLVKSAADYERDVASLGPVDVLCAHVPPNLPGLRYDVVPARLEMYGPGLLEAIDTHQPELAVFGHVHQPLVRRARRGRTECVNVGHFQRFPTAHLVDWD
jgi:Icc-related predicted phosphoesterase